MTTLAEAGVPTIMDAARDLFQQEVDWVLFHREILGVDGMVRRQYPNYEDMRNFEKSVHYVQLLLWVNTLRDNKRDDESLMIEPEKVITVRLPRSLRESLRIEAHSHNTSMNKLCVTKLLPPLAAMNPK